MLRASQRSGGLRALARALCIAGEKCTGTLTRWTLGMVKRIARGRVRAEDAMSFIELSVESAKRLDKWEAVVRSWNPRFCDFAEAYVENEVETVVGPGPDELLARLRAEYKETWTKQFDYPVQDDEFTIVERLLWLKLLRGSLAKVCCYADNDKDRDSRA
jgi:hypothetical protein